MTMCIIGQQVVLVAVCVGWIEEAGVGGSALTAV